MSETLIEAIKVHLVGSDIPIRTQAVPTAKPGRNTSFRTFLAADIVADGMPRMLLGQAPSRSRAVVSVTGTAGDTVVLAGSMGDAQNAGSSSATIPVGFTFVLSGTDEVWLGAGAGDSPVVGVIAEYEYPNG